MFQNLASGQYTLETRYDGVDPVSESVSIDATGNLSAASFTSSATTVSIADAIIQFNATATGASEYTWDFGDGTVLSGTANPVHPYTETGIYTVTLTITGGGCSSVATSQITVTSDATSVADADGNGGVVIYPNPANEQFSVLVNSKEPVFMELTDVTGKVVMANSQLVGNVTKVNTTHLAAGAYMAVIKTGDTRKMIRVVITH